MQQGDKGGDLSLSLDEQIGQERDELEVARLSSEPTSPLDGGGDLGKGFKGDAHEAEDGVEMGKKSDGKRQENGGEEFVGESSPLPSNPPIVIQSPTLTDNGAVHSSEGDAGSAERASPIRSTFHKRNDSVPLKRYDVESGFSNSHFISSLGRVGEEQSKVQHFQEFGIDRRVGSFSETEDAGLDFVDVRLDQDMTRHSPYGPGAWHASRSAVEIRQDSISSNSEAAKKVAKDAEEREARAGSSHSHRNLHRRERSMSDEGSTSSHGSRSPSRKSVEGRYMGRRSRPVSRAASPEPNGIHRSSSVSLAVPHALDVAAGSGGLSLAFAGEDGEVSAVESPINGLIAPQSQDEDAGGQVVEGEERESKEGPSVQASPPHHDDQGENIEKMEEGEEAQETEKDSSAEAEGEGGGAVAGVVMASTDSVNSLSDAADKEKKTRRRESSNKPSALEQHVSRTRMTTLPPKPKQEDVKHLHDFEAMMRLSREIQVKKQQELEERRRAKDAELQENMKVWEKDILPSWTRARRELKLRKLWWKGIPPSVRGRLWALACGNNQMLPRNLYATASVEAQRSRQDGRFPLDDLQALEEDIEGTLPSLKLFQKDTGALYDDLFSVLSAFVIVRMDQVQRNSGLEKGKAKEGGEQRAASVYPTGVASLAAMLLTNLTPSETLIALLNLIAERPWLRALYSLPSSTLSPARTASAADPVAGFERVFDTLLADQMPKVYANMQGRGVRPSGYVTRWVKTLFVPYLPFDLVARLWDCILLDEGDALIFRSAIALVSLLSARLYVPDKAELISTLRGNNRAALGVWYRFRTDADASLLSPLAHSPGAEESGEGQGQPMSVEAPPELVPLDNIYGGQYDINEGNLFGALEEQGAWWKDSTLERLLDRELVT